MEMPAGIFLRMLQSRFQLPEAYSEPSRTSKMELLVKVVNENTPDVRPGSEYASNLHVC